MRRRRTWRWVAWLAALAVSAALGATAVAAADQVEPQKLELTKLEKPVDPDGSLATTDDTEWG